MGETTQYWDRVRARVANSLLAELIKWQFSPRGRSAGELCQALTCSEAILFNAIQALHRRGVPVVEGEDGYRIAREAAEIEALAEDLEARAQDWLAAAETQGRGSYWRRGEDLRTMAQAVRKSIGSDG